MGLFTLSASVVLVILQTTVILLGRPESAWSFDLVRATPTQTRPVLQPWNPHLLLLALCGLQTIVAIARHQAPSSSSSHEESTTTMGVDHLPLGVTSGALLAILVSCIVVHAVHDTALVQYPTMLALLALILAGVWFMWQHSVFWGDPALAQPKAGVVDVSGFWAWALAFHMQAVGVPLAGLSLALFGSRQWADLATVFVLLSAAVNLVWLQLRRRGGFTMLLGGLIAALVTFGLYLGHVQFGPADTWRYVLALMGSAGLAVPAYLVCLAVPANRDGVRERGYHGLSLMACNVALLCLIVTLSQLDSATPSEAAPEGAPAAPHHAAEAAPHHAR